MRECIINWGYAFDSGCPYYENGSCWLDEETEETRLCVIKDYEWDEEE